MLSRAIAIAALLMTSCAAPSMRVQAIQHRGWWELRYPDGTVAANELHIPAGRSVAIDATLDGFGILFPPRRTFRLRSEETRVIEGLRLTQPRTSKLMIIADEHFDEWLALQRRNAPTNPTVARGKAVFLTARCTLCHTVRGVAIAEQPVAPDLTHVASRRTLAAGVIPNNLGYLSGWIVDPETIKPRNGMPINNIASDDLQSLLAFLETLR